MTGEWTTPSRKQSEPRFAEDNLMSTPDKLPQLQGPREVQWQWQ